MSETVAGNAPEARTETGALVDQTPAVTTTTTPTPPTETTEAKPTEAKPAESNTSLLNEEAPAGAPEAYTDFTLPEGYTLDKTQLDEAAPLFKEMNLSQDQAQKLVDFYVKQQQAAVDKPYQQYMEVRKGWADSVKAEFGNKLPEVKATIGRALATLPAETVSAFRQAMDMTGAGDNPAFVKAFYDLAKRATEGRPVTAPRGVADVTAPGAPAKPSAAQSLYPNLPSASPQ
jgi:hypothetical protein